MGSCNGCGGSKMIYIHREDRLFRRNKERQCPRIRGNKDRQCLRIMVLFKQRNCIMIEKENPPLIYRGAL